jgi:hypothetical protein
MAAVGRRGTALLLAVFFMTVCTFLAYACVVLTPTDEMAARKYKVDVEAELAADAGIQDAMAWLHYTLDAGLEPITSPPASPPNYALTRSGTLGPWVWNTTVQPDAHTSPATASPQSPRIYKVTSVSSLNGKPCRQIVAWVEAGMPVSAWARLEDQSTPGIYFDVPSMNIDGPLHYNGVLSINVTPGFYSVSGPPPFGSTATSSTLANPNVFGDGVNWDTSGDVPYDAMGNPIAADFNRLFAGGRAALQTGVAPVPFPTSTVPQSQLAWASAAPPPTATGVYLPTSSGTTLSGGVYIVGDVQNMVLGVDAHHQSTMTFQQGATNYQIIKALDAPTSTPKGTSLSIGQTALEAGASETVYSGTPNGVVYLTGSVNGLQGVNRGAESIITALGASNQIVLSGNITRADTPVGARPNGTTDELGIISENIHIPASITPSTTNPLIIYANLLAGNKGGSGSLVVDNPNASPGGYLELFGSLAEEVHVPFGTYTNGTYVWTWTSYWSGYWTYLPGVGVSGTGMSPHFHFDTLAALLPPPGYPVAGGKSTVLSWQENVLGP